MRYDPVEFGRGDSATKMFTKMICFCRRAEYLERIGSIGADKAACPRLVKERVLLAQLGDQCADFGNREITTRQRRARRPDARQAG